MLIDAYERIIDRLLKDNQSALDIIEHNLKKGEQNEALLKENIRKILPSKMILGNGFIVCSDPTKGQSREQDIIIYDNLENIPLELNDVFGVFPIESVYGTIEVKTKLTKEELEKSFKSNRQIRDMTEGVGKFYTAAGTSIDQYGNPIVKYIPFKSNLSPRFFIFSYSCSVKNIETLINWFETLSKETNSHCHGLCVLDKGWFIKRNAYDKPHMITKIEQNGHLTFFNALRLTLGSMDIRQADMNNYIHT